MKKAGTAESFVPKNLYKVKSILTMSCLRAFYSQTPLQNTKITKTMTIIGGQVGKTIKK